uniref:Uncharacterized protein n=1 Tax=Pristionchus pacificus TaxID=54126 RepID=A0A2A6CET8_PRIPA|eukprot:PDM76712.1 hypothetical protein PRIPAC_42107 [Pristionchus pacificus]
MLSYDVDIKARRRLRLVLSKMRPEKKQKRSSSAISNIFPLGQVARQYRKGIGIGFENPVVSAKYIIYRRSITKRGITNWRRLHFPSPSDHAFGSDFAFE